MEGPPGEPPPPEPPPAHSTESAAVGTAGGSAVPHIPLTRSEGDGLGCVGVDSVDATRVPRVDSSSGDSSSSSPGTESGQKKPGDELTIDLGGGGKGKEKNQNDERRERA